MLPHQADQTTRHVGAGLTLAVVVGLFAYGGYWLDQRTGLAPLFLLVGLVLGCVGGFIHLVNVVAPEMLPFGRKDSSASKGAGDEGDTPDDRDGPPAG